MCGIVGAIGSLDFRSYLLNGLHKLEYRGYDSCGVYISNGKNHGLYKSIGTVDSLESKVPLNLSFNPHVGIAHTRWATHGGVTLSNCHPVYSSDHRIMLVHNGVIENFESIRNFLIEKGISFSGNTDSEVIANLLSFILSIDNSMTKAIERMMQELNGSYALAIIDTYDTNKLYFAKNLSPLLIGKGEGANYLASDQIPMADITHEFIDLKDGQYGYMSKDDIHLFEKGEEINFEFVSRSSENLDVSLNGYEHYMLKEIEETPSCIERLIKNYIFRKKYTFDKKLLRVIERSTEIIFLACGTSYHASLVAVDILRARGKIANAYIASEFAYHPVIMTDNPLFIIISQSGETADIIKCLPFITDNAYHLLTITNNRYSSLARKAEYYLNLYSGVEVSVASTKVYQSELVLLLMLFDAIYMDLNLIESLHKELLVLKDIINRKEEIKPIAKELANYEHCFILGRGLDYDSALEAALKIKEVTYIHASAVQAGELKHGPIALVSQDFPSLAFISEEKTAHQMRNGFQEVKARGGKVFVISSKSLAEENDSFVVLDSTIYLAPMAKVMVAQYLTYFITLEKGFNVDKPRNLAKSVTVE